MIAPTIRVLIAEDVAADAELEIRELKRAGLRVTPRIVDRPDDFVAALREFTPHVILSDFSMPGFDGMEALALAREISPDTPFVFVSGTIGVEPSRVPRSTREWLNLLHPDDRQRFRSASIEAGVKGARVDIEFRLQRPEEELRESESLKGAVLESSLDALITIDRQGNIVEFNPAAEASFGISRQQALGKVMAELIIPPRLREAHNRGFAHYLTTGEGPILGKRLELQAMRADGTEFPIELAITVTNTGAAPLFTGFIRDITNRKEAEEKIRRLNRVYAVLSGINALIVRARDREELLREACGLAVEAGKFRMAWIGLVDREAMLVKPVAWHGTDAEYIHLMPLGLVDTEAHGRGLAGQAVRERTAITVDDMTQDPRILLRKEALERGFRSLIMLPLMIAEESVGVLALYAGEVGFFDEEEMKLLRELAGDIAFALEHMQKEERLRRLTRVNAMLSGINGVIARVRDRRELFQEACRIAVDTGGLRFAWLCIVDEKEMSLKPVASAGADEGFLKMIESGLSLRDAAPEGHGISAVAVRERRALVVSDMQSDPRVRHK